MNNRKLKFENQSNFEMFLIFSFKFLKLKTK